MFFVRAVGVILAGAFMAGCAAPQAPKAAPPVMSVDEQTMAGLEQSWRSSHPGSYAGHVNAVLPGGGWISVIGLPVDQIQERNVVEIVLDRQGGQLLPGVVESKNAGYLQVSYGALSPGLRPPQIGDLVVWFPGGASVPPSPSEPTTEPLTGAPNPAEANPAAPTTTAPAEQMPQDNNAPAPAAPPETTTAPTEATTAPAEAPTATENPASQPSAPETQPEAAPETQPAPAPESQPAPEPQAGTAPESQPAAAPESQPAAEPLAGQPSETQPAPASEPAPSEPPSQEKPDLNK